MHAFAELSRKSVEGDKGQGRVHRVGWCAKPARTRIPGRSQRKGGELLQEERGGRPVG